MRCCGFAVLRGVGGLRTFWAGNIDRAPVNILYPRIEYRGWSMQEWPADKVERWPLDRLVPYARNARTHSDAQVAQIAGSIREWGWTKPVLVDENGIIAGHGRVLAARKLGLTEVPVMVARGWSEAQKRAYVIADNKLALNAGWDEELLRLELADLQGHGLRPRPDRLRRRGARRAVRRPAAPA